MKYAAAALTLLLICPLAALASTLEGTWTASIEDDSIQLSVRYGRGTTVSLSAYDQRLPLTELRGLDLVTAASAAQQPVAFQLEREPGSVRFEGVFRDGKGAGHFHFTPASDFGARLSRAGVAMPEGGIEPEKQLLMLMLDVSSSLVQEMRSLGYDRLSLEEVVKIAIFRVTPAMVREFRAAGYRDLSIQMLTKLRIHRVTLPYLRSLEELGIAPLSLDRAAEMRIHDVTPEYIRELRTLGYSNLGVDELIQMRIFRVTPELIRQLAAAGYTDIPVKKLIQMKIHGADEILLQKRR